MNKLLVMHVLAVLLASAPAPVNAADIPEPTPRPSASQLGKAGTFSLGAERLFGLSHASPSTGSSITTFSFLGGSGLEAGVAPYSIPRLAFDYFPSDALSLGLSAEVATVSPENGNSETIVAVNPRLGYLAHVSDGLSVWPRAGISYVNASSGGRSAYLLAGTLELQLVATPLQHLAFMFGPTFDLGLAATGSKLTQLGLQAGLLGWF